MKEDDEEQILSKKKIDFERMSIDELEDLISFMKEQITAAEQEIKRKKSHINAASALFK